MSQAGKELNNSQLIGKQYELSKKTEQSRITEELTTDISNRRRTQEKPLQSPADHKLSISSR